ncbi:MAG: hypothetical protein V1874_04275 [Spirochaetota bacterium]
MKSNRWYLIITVVLLLFSAIFYLIQISIFHKTEDTFFYLLQDLSFVPVQVLLVTLILDRLLKKREKNSFLNKLNMVIGVFYNDIGNRLLELFGKFALNNESISSQLRISNEWKEKDFRNKINEFRIHPEDINPESEGLYSLKKFLTEKNQGLLNLLANPNLLEHDTFTNLLWAVFHLADELMHREKFDNLPQSDLNHLRGDLVRAYQLIVLEWLSYMKHLKKDYPYLFSIAVRTNPFNPDAEITVKQP